MADREQFGLPSGSASSAEICKDYSVANKPAPRETRDEKIWVEGMLDHRYDFVTKIIESLDHPFYVIDAYDFTIKLKNSAAARQGPEGATTCYSLSHARQTPCNGTEHPCPLEIVRRTKRSCKLEHTHYTREGKAKFVEVHAHPIFDQQGNVTEVIEYCLDITERRVAEESLRKQEQQYRNLVETSNDLIWSLDSLGTIIFVNRNASRAIFGYESEEMIGLSFVDLVHPDYLEKDLATFEELMAGKSQFRYETAYRRKDGSTVYLTVNAVAQYDEHGMVTGASGTASDISDRRQVEHERLKHEQQIRHAQKLESLGILAGGIAHDFNNILVGIMGNADLALLNLADQSSTRKTVESIKKASIRASELTKQMLAYSGKGTFHVTDVNLNQLVIEMVQLLKVSISKRSRLEFDLAEDLPDISADATQIRQVVLNLITNASEAIEDKQGVITIRTGTLSLEEDKFIDNGASKVLRSGNYVWLEVSDTGQGMKEDVLAKIFDPFFSTKFVGRGLGLAATLGIMRSHGGTIEVSSGLQKGTTFRTIFSADARAEEKEQLSEDTLDQNPAVTTGTILLVDDEQIVRDVAQEMLEHLGFAVLLASSGEEALKIFDQRQDSINALILDMTMPGMSGEEVFREIKERSPNSRVYLSSGYDPTDSLANLIENGLSGFVQKPYQLETLSIILGEA